MLMFSSVCIYHICCSLSSVYQWCGTTPAYCDDCCQNGPCTNGPSPTLPTGPGPTSTANPTTPGFNYNATHGEDSRLIAYVSNWQTCPTAEQVDAYSHIVIAFAVSYGYVFGKNDCNTECKIAPTVPICNNQNDQGLVDQWRAAGKKVILSFGGAGMGGSWAGKDLIDCTMSIICPFDSSIETLHLIQQFVSHHYFW